MFSWSPKFGVNRTRIQLTRRRCEIGSHPLLMAKLPPLRGMDLSPHRHSCYLLELHSQKVWSPMVTGLQLQALQFIGSLLHVPVPHKGLTPGPQVTAHAEFEPQSPGVRPKVGSSGSSAMTLCVGIARAAMTNKLIATEAEPNDRDSSNRRMAGSSSIGASNDLEQHARDHFTRNVTRNRRVRWSSQSVHTSAVRVNKPGTEGLTVKRRRNRLHLARFDGRG